MPTILPPAATMLAAILFLGACGEGTASSDQLPVAETTDAGDIEPEPTALVDGEACASLTNLVDEIGNLNGQAYEDTDGVRAAMTDTLAAMEQVEATAPTALVADHMALALRAWRPWHDEMEAVGFDFFALDPKVFEMFDEPEAGRDTFVAHSNHVLSYAVENCGVPQATVDAATGANRGGADLAPPDGDATPTLIDTGVTMSIWIDGEELTMEHGFCGVGPDGILVGSYESGDTKVSILYDTSGRGLATISVERPGSTGGAQVEVEYGEGQGAFRSGTYVGTFTCDT